MSNTGEAGAEERNAFWDDLARDLEDPELLAEYIAVSNEIARIDARYRRS